MVEAPGCLVHSVMGERLDGSPEKTVESNAMGFAPALSVSLDRLAAFEDRTSLRDPKALERLGF